MCLISSFSEGIGESSRKTSAEPGCRMTTCFMFYVCVGVCDLRDHNFCVVFLHFDVVLVLSVVEGVWGGRGGSNFGGALWRTNAQTPPARMEMWDPVKGCNDAS